MKILLVEESDSDIESYKIKNSIEIETVFAKTVSEAIQKIDGSFDGAIIDLKLEKDGDEGNHVISEIKSNFRIPIIVFTGTPENINSQFKPVETFKKGECTYEHLLNIIFEIFSTGLTKIMGGRGKLENSMNDIFWKNLIPSISSWRKLSKSGNTEEALLRYTISHLHEMLSTNSEYSLPEETYIYPPIMNEIKPGSIVFNNETNEPFLILSPACDLARRADGQIKTDRILVSHIENFDQRFKKLIKEANTNPKNETENQIKLDAELQLNKIIRNNMHIYYHYLPKSDFFSGGLINFRKINTYKINDFTNQFTLPKVQISSHFIKDVISRFSAFYSRQGQPDFDFNALILKLKNEA